MNGQAPFVIAVLIFFVLLGAATADEFYAYYTRLPYGIPLDGADYIPTELDAESRAILEAMERLMADRTAFIIAHRLSTLEFCHTVLVIEDGRVAATGAPGSLAVRQAMLATESPSETGHGTGSG